MDRFAANAEQLEGIARAQDPQLSRDGTIAMARLQLDRPPPQVPPDTAERLIDDAEEVSGPGLEVALAGAPIRDAEGGSPPEVRPARRDGGAADRVRITGGDGTAAGGGAVRARRVGAGDRGRVMRERKAPPY
jgi:hypothetical protein